MYNVVPGHKYFDWGYSDDNLYALYSPSVDKIIFLANGKECAVRLCLLISSKIHLIPVNISKAANYSRELIDNECCVNWKLSDVSSLKINLPFHRMREDDIVDYRKNLVPTDGKISYEMGIIRDFLFLSNWVLEVSDKKMDLTRKYAQGFIPLMKDGIFESFYHLRLQCMEKIHTGVDFTQTSNEVEIIIQEMLKNT